VCESYEVDLFDVDYHVVAARPVEEVREMLSVPPKARASIEYGSAGAFEPEGMSDAQRRRAAQRSGVQR